jgi:hypothetical protein
MKLKLPLRRKDRLPKPTLDYAMEAAAGDLGAKKGYVSTKLAKLKPKSGYSHVLHIILTVLLPIILYVLVRIGFAQLAVALVLLSKWRMFAVKARHWPANIRANAVDITVGISTVLFMANTYSQGVQIIWAVLYAGWLLFIKPKSASLWVGVQAMAGQAVGLMALYTVYGNASTAILVLATAGICYVAARHFFSAFDEHLGRTISYVWAYFGASISWLLSHWLIYYGSVAQPVLILTVVGYTMAALYYLRHTERLSANVQRQFIFVLTAILLILIVFSDWSDKAI